MSHNKPGNKINRADRQRKLSQMQRPRLQPALGRTAKPASRPGRFMPSRAQLVSGAMIFTAGMLALAAVPNIFTSGTTISSTAVNTNFTALDTRIIALETKLASVTNVTVNGQPTVRFSGVNVRVENGNMQIVSGSGSTAGTPNGKGNLIVGYDEADSSGLGRCTVGWNSTVNTPVTDATTCTAAGGTWDTNGFKTGSHYIIAGSQNNYSSFGGLMAGFRNTGNYDYASVSGGGVNTASALGASVSGGSNNNARGPYASVSGGYGNTASYYYASVSGGYLNIASGQYASVSGGNISTASGNSASVSGGNGNLASGSSASVSGGWACGAISSNKWSVGQDTVSGCGTLGN